MKTISALNQSVEQLIAGLHAGCRHGRSADVYYDGWCGFGPDARPSLVRMTTTAPRILHQYFRVKFTHIVTWILNACQNRNCANSHFNLSEGKQLAQ